MTASATQRTLDLCTLVWPELDLGGTPVRKGNDDARWLVGWNPRGLVMVAATFIDAPSFADAAGILSRIKGRLERSNALRGAVTNDGHHLFVARGLRILGRIRMVAPACLPPPSAGGAIGLPQSAFYDFDDAAAASAKTVRQQADIWVELQWDGRPSVVELSCCGYKVQQFHLHVVHCDPMCDNMQLSPVVFSVLSHYGMDGVKAILQSGAQALGGESRSTFEGKMLPKHLLALLNLKGATPHAGLELLRAASTLANASGGNRDPINSVASTPNASPSKINDGQRPVLDIANLASPPPPPRLAAGSTAVSGDSFASDASSFGSTQQMAPDAISPTAQPKSPPLSPVAETRTSTPQSAAADTSTRPPRLDFPERADLTELSCWLVLCNAGTRIRRELARPAAAAVSTALASEGSNPSMATKSMCLGVALRALLALLPMVTLLARISYVARMLEYRQRECINWIAIFTGRSMSCGLHPLMPHLLVDGHCAPSQRRVCTWGFVVRVIVDILLGVLLSLLLMSFGSRVTEVIRSFAWYGLNDLHEGCVEWFRGWPAGFKMNDDLNMAISTFHMTALSTWSDILTLASVDWIYMSYAVLVAMAPLGASFSLCFVADCCNLVTQHLRLQFHIMEILYRGFVTLLSCLVAQFRGRKYNPLRKRTDACEFDMDQMLLGTLLCTAALFLLPTVAIYYFYFALVRTSVWVVQEALHSAAFSCSNVPLYHLIHWCVYRKVLPSGVVLSNPSVRAHIMRPTSPTVVSLLRTAAASSPASSAPTGTVGGIVVDMELNIVPMPLSEALFDHTVMRWALTRPFALAKLMRFIILGEEKPCVNAQTNLFPHLCRDAVHPSIPIASAPKKGER